MCLYYLMKLNLKKFSAIGLDTQIQDLDVLEVIEVYKIFIIFRYQVINLSNLMYHHATSNDFWRQKKKSFLAVPILTKVVSSNLNNLNSIVSKCNDTIIDFTNQTSQPYVESSIQSPPDNPVEHNFLNNNLSNKLQSWIIEYKVAHNCGNSLLSILKTEGLNVPKDVRTLLKTPKVHNIENLSHGSYIHLGLEQIITPILKKYNANDNIPDHILKIGINIDGLPISSSSKSQLWPILISILNFRELPNNVIPIGIFHGTKKPNTIEEFMNPFISDILNVLRIGLNDNGILFKLEISNIICDAPAKAFLLNVKSHNAYSGCTSCTDEGTYLEHRMAYLSIDSPLRSDESFRNKIDHDYHKEGISPLISLPIDITKTVDLDYRYA